ncbi:MAG: GTP diphosphokinase [Anaerolineae bacterium]
MNVKNLLEEIHEDLSQSDIDLIRRAYDLAALAHADQERASGEPYIVHSLAVAQRLAELRLDSATIAAGLLHDVAEDTNVTIEDLRQDFGGEVAKLVDGVTKLEQIDQLSQMSRRTLEYEEAESLRKMFLAMVDDVRVVLIKLADRLHNMHTLSALQPSRRRRFARETLDIFAPLASRLGIWQIKWELEDLSLRHLEPQKYQEIARLVAERRADRENHIVEIVDTLRKTLKEGGIPAEVTGRPKHIYSIYKKMERKGIDFDQIYDVRGVRIIVNEVKDCYATLGIVHSLCSPIPGEFDDFIATPKDNMYQSLHTAVVAPGGKPLEVQIRTHAMHRTAELGIAAHWRYKEQQAKRDVAFENKIAWLRSLVDWRQEVADAGEFVDSVKRDVFQDRVYVFSPKGAVFDLPASSTPIDFAYSVHTEIGHRCRGAKVNGRLVALSYQLQSGDQVEILTTKRGGPSRDWLNPVLNYTQTARARQKIRQWFRRQNRTENIARGREQLEKELKRLGVNHDESYESIAGLFGFGKVDDFLAAIGYGDINAQQIATKVLQVEREEREEELKLPEFAPPPLPTPGIRVKGVGNLLTRLARCCNPLPGDDIIGYVTRGQGVTIHRKDCLNMLRREDTERFIEVDWGQGVQQTYPVVIRVIAYDREGLLRDIAGVVADEDISMSAANVVTRKKENMATITATLEITDIAQLSRVLAKIDQLPNVLEAKRQAG